ncbi:hypothetical protein [Lacihabitans sp. LS3-19]|uniref:hypothetical protein n=1 Tax=Lacihabitans sp. LS3-19 TaxID=2487335 RepID=UPI0020CFD644|nr:hypothetical protein [Lacihabitans sp. LS3-19]
MSQTNIENIQDTIENKGEYLQAIDDICWKISESKVIYKEKLKNNEEIFQDIIIGGILISQSYGSSVRANGKFRYFTQELMEIKPNFFMTYLSTIQHLEDKIWFLFDTYLKNINLSNSEWERSLQVILPELEKLENTYYQKYNIDLDLAGHIGKDLVNFKRHNINKYSTQFVISEFHKYVTHKVQTDLNYFFTVLFLSKFYFYQDFNFDFLENIANEKLCLEEKQIFAIINPLSEVSFNQDFFNSLINILSNWSISNNCSLYLINEICSLACINYHGFKLKNQVFNIVQNLSNKNLSINKNDKLWYEVICSSILRFDNLQPNNQRVIEKIIEDISGSKVEGVLQKNIYDVNGDEGIGIHPENLELFNSHLAKKNIPYQFIEIRHDLLIKSKDIIHSQFKFDAIVLVNESIYNQFRERFIDDKSFVLSDKKQISFGRFKYITTNSKAVFNSIGYNKEILPYLTPNILKRPKESNSSVQYAVHKIGFFYNDDGYSAEITNGTLINTTSSLKDAQSIKSNSDLKTLRKLKGSALIEFYMYEENVNEIKSELRTFFKKHFNTDDINSFPEIDSEETASELLNILNLSFHNIIKYENQIDSFDFENLSNENECWEP